MSSPVFSERRPLPGKSVAENAELYVDNRFRELIYFLQALSMTTGGISAAASFLVAANPTWQISDELRKIVIRNNHFDPTVGLVESRDVNACGDRVWIKDESDWFSAQMAEFLTHICLDPAIDIASGENNSRTYSCLSGYNFSPVIDELLKQKACIEKQLPREFVETSISKEIFETLDYSLESQQMVVIEGKSGIGKTTGTAAWMASHQGVARHVSLSGINNKTRFFQKIGDAIGISTGQKKAMDLQWRVEDFFAKTRFMLVIEEAQWLWPRSTRICQAPELVDWVNTALVNEGVPVALICTDQFPMLKARVEKETGWNSDQLMHRIARYKMLPERPADDDIVALTRHRLSFQMDESGAWMPSKTAPDSKSIDLIVNYAKDSKLPFAAVRDSINEARRQAKLRGDVIVSRAHVRRGFIDYQMPSDAAMKHAFDATPAGKKNRRTASQPFISIPAAAAVREGHEEGDSFSLTTNRLPTSRTESDMPTVTPRFQIIGSH